jgi:hypothetical protein
VYQCSPFLLSDRWLFFVADFYSVFIFSSLYLSTRNRDKINTKNTLYFQFYATTCTCERGFSCMSRVKTTLRNRLTNTILQGLMMVSVHGPDDSEFDYRRAMTIWGKLRKRHILVEKAKVHSFAVALTYT